MSRHQSCSNPIDLNTMNILLVEMLRRLGFVKLHEQFNVNELPCRHKFMMESFRPAAATTASSPLMAAAADDDDLADACRVVLERLGMDNDHRGGTNKEERRKRMIIIGELLEEKEASMEELEEAFYVYDRNEDGYVTAEEVWGVMRRLGMDEGLRLEDCRRMIGVFDEDGDGKISFHEFTKMMQNAA